MRVAAMIGAGVALSTAVCAAHAGAPGRFVMEKTPDGYIRMDTQTGAMSLCQETPGRLVCQAAGGGQSPLEEDVRRLQARVEKLEKQVHALESGDFVPRALPSDEQFDKSLDYMERFFRRFMGIMRDFDQDQKAAPTAQGPDRT